MKFVSRTVAIAVGFFITMAYSPVATAQCAMCRATLENNVSNGEIGIAASINTGILYLFAMPYLLVGIIAFMWYRRSRINPNAQGHSSR